MFHGWCPYRPESATGFLLDVWGLCVEDKGRRERVNRGMGEPTRRLRLIFTSASFLQSGYWSGQQGQQGQSNGQRAMLVTAGCTWSWYAGERRSTRQGYVMGQND